MDGIFEFVGGKVYDYFKITNSNEERRSYRPDSLHLFSCETSHYIFIAIFLAPAPHLQDHVFMGMNLTCGCIGDLGEGAGGLTW